MTDGDANAELHLQQCLDEAERGAGLRYAYGVRNAIADDRRARFYANEPRWPAHGHKVLHAALFVGRFARLFADFDGEQELREVDMRMALGVVKNMCDARLVEQGGAERFEWCS